MKLQSLRTKTNAVLLIVTAVVALGAVLWWARSSDAQAQVLRIGGSGAYLGVRMEDVTAGNMAKYKLTREIGVIVRSVEKGSPAEAATLQENDVILEYCGIPVISAIQLGRLVEETPVGRQVDLVISREGKRLNLTAKLGERGRSNIEVLPRGQLGEGFDFVVPGGRGLLFRGPGGSRSFSFDFPFETRPRLGVTLEPLTGQMAEFLGVPGKEGALVTSVTKGSPADTKLRAGDVIISADGKSIRNPEDLTGIIRGKEKGATTELRLIRDKKEITVSVQLDDGSSGRGYKV
jgi:serine protease Do